MQLPRDRENGGEKYEYRRHYHLLGSLYPPWLMDGMIFIFSHPTLIEINNLRKHNYPK